MKVAKFLNIIFIFILFSLFSCSHYRPVQEGRLDIFSGSSGNKNQNNFKVLVETENLLWGIVPDDYKIELTDSLNLDRYKYAGKMSVKSYQTFSQKALMLLSLGIYVPETLEFEFWGEYVKTE